MTKYREKFEKMRVAGNLASKTLDMLTDIIKPGVSTNKIDQLAYDFIKDNGGYSAPQFYRKIDTKISIATVYRTVKLFEEAGILTKHDFKTGTLQIYG